MMASQGGRSAGKALCCIYEAVLHHIRWLLAPFLRRPVSVRGTWRWLCDALASSSLFSFSLFSFSLFSFLLSLFPFLPSDPPSRGQLASDVQTRS
jgi:hypothetical protein